jgi:hypothetical protein
MGETMKITFTNTMGVPEEYSPKPASRYVPDWYKNLESYISGEKKPDGNAMSTATIKRCMPVFDAINSGYIIPTPCDIWVKQVPLEEDPEKTQPYYEWANFGIIQFHPIEQAPVHPNNNGHTASYPKWINSWAIKTPPGYSVAFVQPWHRDSVFTILPGIVDTDTYSAPVNFPFVLNEPTKFEGLIPAGTPMAQVIPFQREPWEMELGGQEELINQSKVVNLLRTKFFDSYKTQYRQIKEYK